MLFGNRGFLQISALILCCGCHLARPRKVISAIPRDTSEAYFVCEHAGLAQAASPYGLSIYWNGPSGNDDSEQQIVYAKRAIEKNDMGIVLTPSAPYAMDTVIQQAILHDMPVVILGAAIPLPPNPRLSFVLNDGKRAGLLAAQHIRESVGERGEVVIAGLDPMSSESTDIVTSFEVELARIAPQIRIVGRIVGPSTFGQSEMEMEMALETHPHIGAIYALDTNSTRGAVAALQHMKSTAKPRIVGYNQATDLLFLLRQGIIDSLIIQDMRAMGRQAVENIVASRGGHSVTPITYREPVLLTRDNIDTEAMQDLLLMDWRSMP